MATFQARGAGGDIRSIDVDRIAREVEEEAGFYQALPRRPWYIRTLNLLGSLPLRNRSRYSYQRADAHDLSSPMQEVKSQYYFAATRLSRRTLIFSILKTIVLVVPVLTLMAFGVVHVIEAIIGRSSLMWDSDRDEFLPNWGKPGHYGADVAHYPTDATRDVLPVPVHSHNDYWRRVPLFEALHYGCIGVEADVWLFDNELYVGHSTSALTRNRTFSSLYVDPILRLLEKQNPQTEFVNASRRGVYDQDPDQTLVLLVDLKTDGRSTFPEVERQLEPLRSQGYLTHWNGTHTVPGAVTIVGTGNTPFDMLVANSTYRDIFFDAPLDRLYEPPIKYVAPEVTEDEDVDVDVDDKVTADAPKGFAAAMAQYGHPPVARRAAGQGNEGLAPDASPDLFNASTSYYASISFNAAIGFVWRGHLSPRQMELIRGQIRGAKKRGLKARYWSTPTWPISLRNHVWHVLIKEGAEILNADDLKAAAMQDWKVRNHDLW